jgi:hypothetical protein
MAGTDASESRPSTAQGSHESGHQVRRHLRGIISSGSPFAARASAQGRTCAFLEDTWLPLLAAIGLVGLVIVVVALVS